MLIYIKNFLYKKILISSLLTFLIPACAIAKIPDQLKGLWEIYEAEGDTTNATSNQPCVSCQKKRILEFNEEAVWLLKGLCASPIFEIRSLPFGKIKEDVFEGKELKEQLENYGKFNTIIPATEKVLAVHISCEKDKKIFLPSPSSSQSIGKEVWIAIRENGQLISETGFPKTQYFARKVSIAKPSFDCKKASNPAERAICDVPALSSLDQVLSLGYRFAINFAKDGDGGEKCMNSIKKIQGQWIKTRDDCKNDANCLFRVMEERAYRLWDENHLCD